jgi:hypothetical protein
MEHKHGRQNLIRISDGVRERLMAPAWRLLGWFVVVETLITIFGVTTAPLLLAVAADTVVGFLIIRSRLEMRAAPEI